MNYKIGQILTSKEDVEIKKGLSGKKVIIPKGNKIIIGADKFAHYIKNGMIQNLPKDYNIDGYDTSGIAEYIFKCLQNHFNINEMLDNYGDTKERFIEEIENALDKIGF